MLHHQGGAVPSRVTIHASSALCLMLGGPLLGSVLHRVGLLTVLIAARVVHVEVSPCRQTAALDLGAKELTHRVLRQLLNRHLPIIERTILIAVTFLVDLRKRIWDHYHVLNHRLLLLLNRTRVEAGLRGGCHRDVLPIVLLAFGVLTPLLVRCGRLRLLQRLEHLQVLLIDLLNLLLARAEVQGARGARHRHELRSLPRVPPLPASRLVLAGRRAYQTLVRVDLCTVGDLVEHLRLRLVLRARIVQVVHLETTCSANMPVVATAHRCLVRLRVVLRRRLHWS